MTGPALFSYYTEQCQKIGISLVSLCRRAKIPESTLHRWKFGTKARPDTLARLDAAFSQLRAEQMARAKALLEL